MSLTFVIADFFLSFEIGNEFSFLKMHIAAYGWLIYVTFTSLARNVNSIFEAKADALFEFLNLGH